MNDLRAPLLDLLDQAIAATNADFGNIQLLSPGNGGLRIAAQRGFKTAFLQFFRVVKHDMSACSAALQRARRVVIRDVRRSAVFTKPARKVLLDAGVYACQSTPILSRGEVVGVISTHFRRPHAPTARQLSRIDALAGQLSALIDDQDRPNRPDSTTTIEEFHDTAIGKSHVVRCVG